MFTTWFRPGFGGWRGATSGFDIFSFIYFYRIKSSTSIFQWPINDISEITETNFHFDDHQTEHIMINWRTFRFFDIIGGKKSLAGMKKWLFSLCHSVRRIIMYFWDVIPIIFCTVSDALFQISGNFFTSQTIDQMFRKLFRNWRGKCR